MGKRGPNKHQGKRWKDGRLSRAPLAVADRLKSAMDRDELDTIAVGIEARERVFGVPLAECRDQRAGSFVGRLRMAGVLSQPQYESAIKWQEGVERYSWATGGITPKRPAAVDLNRVSGSPTSAENVAAAKRAIAKYRNADKVIRDAQIELGGRGNLFGALDALVLRDLSLQHMVPDLRCALNALAKHYRFEERVAA